ncbi:MAG TPA: TonB-dependent receptor [Gemmatimonadaceae bacterium]|nr:TonB-dependent receptor [Gemmatimonadaceae bacterium]
MRSRIRIARLITLALLTVVPASLVAQDSTTQVVAAPDLPTGQIVGRVVDGATGQGLADVGVQIVGTRLGVSTGVDGRFFISHVPAGTVTIQARRIGFAAKTVTGVILNPGETVDQSIALSSATVQLTPLVVSATSERGTVNSALDAQRTAVGVVNAVTAQQISRSPDANAAQAVQRVSGVTVQDDKYVFVRGLGERYTTSSLNGARVPSPEPEKRVVPLDMFPAGLLQSVTTTKTFTPDLQGDFSGALVDIKTQEFPANRSLSLQFGGGYQAGTTGTSVIKPQLAGGEHIANVNDVRALPTLLASIGNFQGLTLTPGDKSLLVSQFRNAWTPGNGNGTPNMSASLSLGGNDPLLLGHRLGYLFSGSYSSGNDFRDNEIRALAERGNTPGETRETDRFVGQRASEGVLWGGLANVSTLVGNGTRLSLNGMYNRTADNDAIIETGSFENEGIRAKITRMDYVQRAIRSLQLAGDHQLGTHNRIEWFGTVSGVRRYEPDRSEFVQAIEQDTPGGPDILRWNNTGNGGADRTFSDLHESSREFNAWYQLGLGADQQSSIKIGGLARSTNRDADTRAYAISAAGIPNSIRELSPEEIFDGRFTSSNIFDIAPLAQGGSYTARDHLGAGFLMTEIALSSRLRLVGGARYEADHLEVDAFSTLGTPVFTHKVWNDLLPSLALNIKLSETQQVRLSATRTLARPEYRELSPIKSRDVLNGDDTQGNENLSRTRISNFDARWEFYPQVGEVLSFGLFAKKFDLPIERVYRAAGSGTRTVFYTNAESADNFGAEIEARKNFSFIADALEPLTLFTNLTAMKSTIHLFKDTEASATNLNRRMVGQAPYVINAGLTYSSSSGASSATLLFNRVGDRIDAAGDSPLPDVVEQARNMMDFSVRLGLTGTLLFRADAKNLLDSPFRVMQGTAVRHSYRTGRVVQAGFQIRP